MEKYMARLKKNETVKTIDGQTIKVLEILGSGGQGIVYKVNYAGKKYALKWYKKPMDRAFYENLAENIKRGSPAKTFLWPLAITEKTHDGSFGYVMELCPKKYKPLSQFLLNNVKFNNLSAMVNAGLQITASFRALHNMGDSYQDLNDGNFFIDPKTGNVLICDNDNVAPNRVNLGILGKPRYMAPEVVCQNCLPDTYSDRFSLAVILFLLFFRGHPLEGKLDNCDRDDNEKSLFCKKPIFVFDPRDNSNRPKELIHKNVSFLWNVYPPFVRNMFIKAFDKNVMNSNGNGREDRVMEKEWVKMFQKLRHSIITCPECGEETFFNMKKDNHICMNCNVNLKRPPVLAIRDELIPLQEGNLLYSYEIDENRELTIETIGEIWAQVIPNPKKTGIIGLKNISAVPWYRHTPGGKEFVCEPNKQVTIIRSNTIKFGTKGEGSFV